MFFVCVETRYFHDEDANSNILFVFRVILGDSHSSSFLGFGNVMSFDHFTSISVLFQNRQDVFRWQVLVGPFVKGFFLASAPPWSYLPHHSGGFPQMHISRQ